jgi:hypothetical protein
MDIWYIFCPFWYLVPKEIWQHCCPDIREKQGANVMIAIVLKQLDSLELDETNQLNESKLLYISQTRGIAFMQTRSQSYDF